MHLLLMLQPDPEISRILGFDLDFLVGMLFIWLNLAVIIFLLSWLLYKPVLNFLLARKERIQNDLDTATENLRSSEEAKVLYNQKLENIGVERDEILTTARKNAQMREAEIISDANKEALLILERAKLEIEREKEKVKGEVKAHIIEVGSLMAERFVGNYLDAGTKDKLLDQAITDLGDVEWTK